MNCYNVEIPKIIHQIIAGLYQLGIWDIEEKSSFRETGRKIFYFVYFVSFDISILVGACITSDKDEFIYLSMVTIEATVQVCRMWNIIWKKKEILTFIHQIGTHRTNDHEEFIQIYNKLKTFIKYAQYMIKFMLIAFIVTAAFPVVSNGKDLVVNIGFFVDWKSSQIGFWMTYLYMQGGLFLSLVCTLFTIIFWYLMLNLVIKYEMLGNSLRNMGAIKTKQKSTVSQREKQNVFLQDMIVAIKSYQQINKIVDQFGFTFSNVLLLQIAFGSICMCGSVYNLAFSSHENWIMDAVYFLILIYCIFIAFVLMYLGNEIKFSSDRLSYSMFESQWVEQTQSTKKLMIIMTEMLKQPQELIVAKLYPLNLTTFTAIVDQAYSMFNILRNLRK